MATSHGCYEIVEAKEELDIQLEMSEKECIQHGHVYSIEDDINRLFQAIDIKTSVGEDTLQKNPMKRPMRVNASQASGIGISESVNLKQALRGLCLSQASEVAAMKRRSLRSAASSSAVSNVGAMKRLYRAVIVEANDSGDSLDKGKSNSVEISLPGKMVPNHNSEVSETTNVSWSGSSNQVSDSSAVFPGSTAIKAKMARAPSPDKVVPLPSEAVDDIPTVELQREQKLKLMQSKRRVCTIKKVLEQGDMFPTKGVLKKSVQQVKQLNDESHSKSYPNSSIDGSKMKKSHTNSLHIRNTVFRNKNFIKRKMKSVSISDSSSVPDKRNPRSDLLNSAGKPVSPIEESTCHDVSKASNRMPSTLSGKSESIGVFSSLLNPLVSKVDTTKVGDGAGVSIVRADERAKLRDKGEISQSSKSSSIGDFSCSTSNSEASSLSGFSRCGSRPHMSKDLRWDIVQRLQKQHGKLNLRHFQLLKRLGAGDIGTVYLAELVSTSSLFALKVMDNEFLAQRKKLVRAETEREILQMLDHPFLPTLYAHFTTDKLSCLVMEYCPGGDLHVLRQRQPCRCFSEKSARFYVAEVLLALEYLHMLGVVYRDLKPENVLVREDGHIMLSDFDLSLRCIVNPTIYRSSPNLYSPKKVSSPCLESSCIDPFCLQPSWQVSCFTPRLLAAASKSRKADQAAQVIPLPQLVAEPTDARSNSFVGTHEYLAPEIIKGVGHGSSVDWWTFGIFLYELLYGKTPFKGSSNEETLANVVSQPLKFPASPLVSFHARNLIKGLLIKEPENRLGFLKGAAEIKQHPFFEGLNWALIRCAQPPKRPRLYDNGLGGGPAGVSHKNQSCKSLECNSDHIEFELF